MTVTVVGCVTPPDVPAIVMVKVPVAARRLTVTVIFDVVLPVIEVGLKPKVTLFSWPVAESAIVGVPLVTCALIVALPDDPLVMVRVFGDALMANTGADAVTVRVTLVVWVAPPPVPVTVMLYVPAATLDATARFNVELPVPGAAMDVGVKVGVTPAGYPLADKATAELNPFAAEVLIVTFPDFPCCTETEPGEAEMLKAGVGGPERAAISAGVGLPQPVTRSKPVTAV